MPYSDPEVRRQKGAEYTRQWRARNHERYRANDTAYQRRRKEELAGRPTPEVCDVCGEPPTTKHGLHFDHDHETGKFRGWLCHHCNVAIGQAKESVERLQKLIQYLEASYA